MEDAAKTILETRLLEVINGWAGHYSALDGLARMLAVFGVLPLAVAAVLLAVCSAPKWRRWGGWVTLISIVPAVFGLWMLDQRLCRPRPFLCHAVRLLLCIPDGVSFPSMEMGAAAALAIGLFAYGGRLRWLALPYVALMGVARVFCGIEYPLDQAWACLVGSLAALVMIVALNPRFLFRNDEGWPVGAVGTIVVLAGVALCSRVPATSLPPQQSTCKVVTPIVGAEQKNVIRGMNPQIERAIANALSKLKLPGQILRVAVGSSESTSVAGIKFCAGPDSNPMPRQVMEREAVAIIRTVLATSPKVSEVDVFGVTTWDRQGREVLNVAYSASARRENARFLFSESAAKLSPAQAMSRFGLTFYRIHRGRSSMRLKLARLSAALALIIALTVGFVLWEHPMDEIATPVINRGYTDDKIVALTFDDGPHPVTTALLLDVLRSHGIRATFFVVGQKAEEYPELLRRIQRGGHQIACHTYSHDNLVCLSRHEANNELTYWENNVDRIVGHGSRFLRPPGGDFDQKTIAMVRQRGYVLSLWSVNPGDWHMPPPNAIVRLIMDRVHPGAVILMHDDGLNTIRALPRVIKGLRHRGYRFVTLEEMERRNVFISRRMPNPLSTQNHPQALPARSVSPD